MGPPPAQGRHGPAEVRIIGGRWKRRKLEVIDRPGLRPTPDRVRETLFNWLGQDLPGWRVLDAFAGSGALGFEAASRGASHVVLLETDARAAAVLQGNRQRLDASGVLVVQADALAWLQSVDSGRPFDLILLDPPYGQQLQEAALAACIAHLGPQGWVYLEDERRWDAAALAEGGWRLHRQGRAGAVHFHLLQRAAPGERLNSRDPAQE